MHHIKGTGIRPVRQNDIERLGLKTVNDDKGPLENMIIFSTNAASFNAAMALMTTNWDLYKDYIGKWDEQVDKRTKKITAAQMKKEQAAINPPKKATKKKDDDSESEEDDASDEEEEEKPKAKANGKVDHSDKEETKVTLKKKATGEKVEETEAKEEGSVDEKKRENGARKGPTTLGNKPEEPEESAIGQAEKKKGSTLRKRKEATEA
jgi:hypothetical protein